MSERPFVDTWISVGKEVTVTLPNGETETEFVTLPVQLSFGNVLHNMEETMKRYPHKMSAARKQLIEELREEFANLPEGTPLVSPDLKASLYKVISN